MKLAAEKITEWGRSISICFASNHLLKLQNYSFQSRSFAWVVCVCVVNLPRAPVQHNCSQKGRLWCWRTLLLAQAFMALALHGQPSRYSAEDGKLHRNWRFGHGSEERAVGTWAFKNGCVQDSKAGPLPVPVEHFRYQLRTRSFSPVFPNTCLLIWLVTSFTSDVCFSLCFFFFLSSTSKTKEERI